jgi:hypothetical protein
MAQAVVAGEPDGAVGRARLAPAADDAVEQVSQPAVPERPRWPSVVARSAPGSEPASPAGAQASTDGAAPASHSGSWATPVGQAAVQEAEGEAVAPGHAERRRAVPARRARLLAIRGLQWVRDRPLEAIAVVLLGLGGAIYPPIWVLGAVMALFSKLWDYRDNWLGLGLPVLLTIIGSIAGVAAGGHSSAGHDFHTGWLFANVLSRLLALLGAAYLAWRAGHGRRPPVVPPWNRAHRIG